jgi:hypothetical protein
MLRLQRVYVRVDWRDVNELVGARSWRWISHAITDRATSTATMPANFLPRETTKPGRVIRFRIAQPGVVNGEMLTISTEPGQCWALWASITG